MDCSHIMISLPSDRLFVPSRSPPLPRPILMRKFSKPQNNKTGTQLVLQKLNNLHNHIPTIRHHLTKLSEHPYKSLLKETELNFQMQNHINKITTIICATECVPQINSHRAEPNTTSYHTPYWEEFITIFSEIQASINDLLSIAIILEKSWPDINSLITETLTVFATLQLESEQIATMINPNFTIRHLFLKSKL